MPFYKKQDGQLVSGEFIDGPGYMLSEAGKDEHTYPVDDWYWFENLDAAIGGMANVGQSEGAVSMRQARLALLQSGLLTQVGAAIAAMPGVEGEAARIEWEYATHVERNSPLVAGLTAALGLGESQLDDLFTLAATL